MYAYTANNPLKYIDPDGEDLEIALSFEGEYTDEEKKKIIAALKNYLSKLDIGKVVVRDVGTEDKRTAWQSFKDFVSGRPDFAVVAITDQPVGLKQLAGKVFTSEFSAFRNDSDAFGVVVADAVLHEGISHQLGLGENPLMQRYDMYGRVAFPEDPYIKNRVGTLYESTRNIDPANGIRPLYIKDQNKIEERLKPINRKYKE